MSTQLILYPQNYLGVYSFNSDNQFVSDGNFFSSIDASTSYSTATTIDTHLFATPPTIISSWFRWRSTSAGTPALPVETSGNLVLNSVSPNSISGVYQMLSNLSVGASYTLTVEMTAVASGLVSLKAYNLNNNSIITGNLLTSNSSQASITFIAQNTNDTIFIGYYNTSATDLTITNISVIPTGISPSQVYTDLVDGQVICDLYQEEDIPLTLSIDDFKSVAEKVQSYSKDFNLPATKRNNRIFNNMFDITRSDDGIIFNPYVKTRSVLKQDGFLLFEGYLRLIDVKEKNGEISYNVNLYSEVIALADVLKDSIFSDLDFSELEHTYNKTTIANSWYEPASGTGLPLSNSLSTSSFAYDPLLGVNQTNVLKYPFIDWTHQFIVGGTNPLSNNANIGFPELTELEQAFRPCIQLKYIINKIFAATNQFTYTSNFFDTADFKKLFMDFNWGADNSPVLIDTSGTGNVDAIQTATTSFVTIQTNNTTFDTQIGYSAGVYTALQDTQTYNFTYGYGFTVVSGVGAWSVTFRWKWVHAIDSSVEYIDVSTITGSGPTTGLLNYEIHSGSFTRVLMDGDTKTPEFKSADASSHNIRIEALSPLFGSAFTTYVSTTSPPVTNQSMLGTLRGELGQWEFLKGLITMFNLVTMVDENNPNNILIEPYSDIFINNSNSDDIADLSLSSRFNGKVHDWTDYIDASQMELKPLTELNKKTEFKFVEDEDDYIFTQFKNAQRGHLYGSKEFDASGFTILEGLKEVIAEPFAATVSKPIMSQFANFVTPAVYTMTDEGTSEGFDNSPRIFYNNGIKDSQASYYVPAQNGVSSGNPTEFLQFSHLSAIPTTVTSPPAATDTRDFVFESNQLLSALGSPPTNNLYSTYWQPYINELYNANTRTLTIKVNLSASDIAAFKFYDTVILKNRTFRVNKIEYKPNTLAKVEFILIP